MKTRILALVLVFFIPISIVCVTFAAGNKKSTCFPESAKYSLYEDEGTLIGLESLGLDVLIWCGEEEEKYGLTKLSEEAVRNDIESLLSNIGVNVLSKEVASRGPLPPSLNITIDPTIIEECGKASVYVALELKQFAFLPRMTNAGCYAVTWSAESHLICEADVLGNVVRPYAIEKVRNFCNAYLEVNEIESQMMTGTVRYLDFEGGFYGLVADNGKKYNPTNLPKKYKKDGLRLRFQVKELKGMGGMRMWGQIVEIVKVQKISEKSR